MDMSAASKEDEDPVYSATARVFHWLTVALVLLLVPVGFLMTYRGKTLGVWDAATNMLYSAHKLLGVTLLVVVVARLIYRFAHGAPADEASLEWWQKIVSHITHWVIYVVLLVLPIVGWVGISMFPALDIFGVLRLPALAAVDKATAEELFFVHGLMARILIALVGMHVGAALFHHFIRKDGVLRRMLPGLKNRE